MKSKILLLVAVVVIAQLQSAFGYGVTLSDSGRHQNPDYGVYWNDTYDLHITYDTLVQDGTQNGVYRVFYKDGSEYDVSVTGQGEIGTVYAGGGQNVPYQSDFVVDGVTLDREIIYGLAGGGVYSDGVDYYLDPLGVRHEVQIFCTCTFGADHDTDLNGTSTSTRETAVVTLFEGSIPEDYSIPYHFASTDNKNHVAALYCTTPTQPNGLLITLIPTGIGRLAPLGTPSVVDGVAHITNGGQFPPEINGLHWFWKDNETGIIIPGLMGDVLCQ